MGRVKGEEEGAGPLWSSQTGQGMWCAGERRARCTRGDVEGLGTQHTQGQGEVGPPRGAQWAECEVVRESHPGPGLGRRAGALLPASPI